MSDTGLGFGGAGWSASVGFPAKLTPTIFPTSLDFS